MSTNIVKWGSGYPRWSGRPTGQARPSDFAVRCTSGGAAGRPNQVAPDPEGAVAEEER